MAARGAKRNFQRALPIATRGNLFFGGQLSDSWPLCRNLPREGQLTVIIGYWLSGAIALGIVLVGARFLLAPHAAAAGYGVSVGPDPRWEAYLSVKAVRDIASGLFTTILILNRSAHLLGWFMLAATIIPLSDSTGGCPPKRGASSSSRRPSVGGVLVWQRRRI